MSARAKTLIALGDLLGVQLGEKPRSKRTLRPYAAPCHGCGGPPLTLSMTGENAVCGRCGLTYARRGGEWRRVER